MVAARDLRFGFFLPTWLGSMGGETPRGRDVIALARLAEQCGFDALWLMDHFYNEPYVDFLELGTQLPEERRGVKLGVWECWTTLSALAVATERATIGTLVTNTGYRNPALLAHMANTVDDLSGGRLILGLGAGDFRSEHQMHGYPWERRVGRFEEALQIIPPLLRGETVSFAGEFYATQGAEIAVTGPRPGGPPILVGLLSDGPRMQRLVARYADIWDCWVAFGDSRPAAYAAHRDAMHVACAKHGRDPASLRRHVTVGVHCGDDAPGGWWTPLTGSPGAVAEQLAAFAEYGVSDLCLWADPKTAAGIEWLARVIALVRA